MGDGNVECWDEVWNPVRGCEAVSEGCRNCTSARMAAHMATQGIGREAGYDRLVRWGDDGQAEWTGKIRLEQESLRDPINQRSPKSILVCSMSDLYHPLVPDSFIRDVFFTMMMAEWHIFYVVTKNTLRMEQWFGSWDGQALIEQVYETGREWPLPNVCMGISAENQLALDSRAAHLVGIPAARRCVILEPLIGDVDLTSVECPLMRGEPCGVCQDVDGYPMSECIDGRFNLLREGIDWVVAGCETGPRTRTRAMKKEWIQGIRDQCEANNTPFFYKQARNEQGVRISRPFLDGRQWMEIPT